MVPPYLVVLLLAGIAGILLMNRASGTWHDAAEAQAFPPEIRRQLVFALLFNAGLLVALAMAVVGEVACTTFRLLRKSPVAPGLVRLGVALLVVVLFAAGHWLANPWVADLARAARTAMGG